MGMTVRKPSPMTSTRAAGVAATVRRCLLEMGCSMRLVLPQIALLLMAVVLVVMFAICLYNPVAVRAVRASTVDVYAFGNFMASTVRLATAFGGFLGRARDRRVS